MPDRSAHTATYAGEMAKVEIDLPDDLLDRLDRAADRAGEPREAFLRRATEQEVVASERRFREEIEAMMPASLPLGRDSAKIIREMRDQRVPPSHSRETDRG